MADSRHLSNRVERDVVEALVDAVRAAHPRLSHRYYAMKARWFGRAQLDHWDRNAPIEATPPRTYDWAQAREVVLASFNDLAHILFDQALLAEGGLPDDPAAYVRRVNALLV